MKASSWRPDASLEACPRCGLVSLSPLPTPTEIEAFYGQTGNWKILEDSRARRLTGRRLKQAARLGVSAGNLYEIGVSRGDFLACAQQRGFKCSGVEPAPLDAQEAQSRGLDVKGLFFGPDHRGQGDQDLVVLWDVLEHCFQPADVLAAAGSHVRPGALLAIAIPNIEGIGARVFKHRWRYRMSPMHLHFFSRRWLCLWAEEHGFEIVAIDGFAKVQSLVNGLFPTHWQKRVFKNMAVANTTGPDTDVMPSRTLRRAARQLVRETVFRINQARVPLALSDLIEVWFRRSSS